METTYPVITVARGSDTVKEFHLADETGNNDLSATSTAHAIMRLGPTGDANAAEAQWTPSIVDTPTRFVKLAMAAADTAKLKHGRYYLQVSIDDGTTLERLPIVEVRMREEL